MRTLLRGIHYCIIIAAIDFVEYYSEGGILDVQPDSDGYIEVDLGKIADYIIKEAHKDEMGDYDPDEILFIVQGEMEYTESLGEE